MVFRNLTCVGGGIAFGSIGQYKDSPDFITNVTATDISVSQSISPLTGGATVAGGAYFKSWVGVEEGVPPQGGGGEQWPGVQCLIRWSEDVQYEPSDLHQQVLLQGCGSGALLRYEYAGVRRLEL